MRKKQKNRRGNKKNDIESDSVGLDQENLVNQEDEEYWRLISALSVQIGNITAIREVYQSRFVGFTKELAKLLKAAGIENLWTLVNRPESPVGSISSVAMQGYEVTTCMAQA